LIRSTHAATGPLITTPDGKRFRTEINPEFAREHYRQRANDGIGTKALLHYQLNTEHYGARDAFGMVMDDLIEGGYIPMSFEDHIQIQEENVKKIMRIIVELVDLAKQNSLSIVAGETAIINTLQGFEVGIGGEGYVRKGEGIIKCAKPGDFIIGIASDKLHSNGYSFVRNTLLKKYDLFSYAPWSGRTIGEDLITPTRLYMPVIKELLREFTSEAEYANQYIRGMVHITGGGLSKLKELVPKGNADIRINRDHKLNPQEIFVFMQKEFAITPEDMYIRFNNGIGYVIAVDPDIAGHTLDIIRPYYPAEIIGNVTNGTGKVIIESKYGSEIVHFD
jgi:phosphoribosylformylglycinamidine cyclo-ligase